MGNIKIIQHCVYCLPDVLAADTSVISFSGRLTVSNVAMVEGTVFSWGMLAVFSNVLLSSSKFQLAWNNSAFSVMCSGVHKSSRKFCLFCSQIRFLKLFSIFWLLWIYSAVSGFFHHWQFLLLQLLHQSPSILPFPLITFCVLLSHTSWFICNCLRIRLNYALL